MERLDPRRTKIWFEDVLRAFGPVRWQGSEGKCRCPFHEDKAPSFSVNAEKGAWHCHAGCGGGGINDLSERLGVPSPFARERKTPVAVVKETVYDYRDEGGKLIFQVVRRDTSDGKKKVLQRRPDKSEPDGWAWNTKGITDFPLYRLPELIEGAKTRGVVIAEGEKCVDALVANGFVATTNHGGAGKWRPCHTRQMPKDRPVVICPDNDKAGLEHAREVASALHAKGCEVRMLDLGYPYVEVHSRDIFDWFAEGHTADDLRTLASNAPVWRPDADSFPEMPEKPKREKKSAPAFEDGLPVIEVENRQLKDIADEAMRAMVEYGESNGPLVYVRGDQLVRIVDGIKGNPKIEVLKNDSMPLIMSRAANFLKGTQNVFPPGELARAVLHAGKWPFLHLRGLVECPVLREDGTVLSTPGYDPSSQLFFKPRGKYSEIAPSPTKRDAQNAAALIVDILSDFPFQDETCRDNMVGLLVTVVVKEHVGLAPMALIDAPTQGTGKGKLAQLASIVATGEELPVSTEVRGDEEWRKQITSLMIQDRPVVVIDNVEHTLYTAQLAAVLTSTVWGDRLLGKSEALSLPNRAIWIATGNNITLGGDIPRRSYWIRLNANMSRPWLRDPDKFKRQLPGWAIDHRDDIVTALLTMARAWHVAGEPKWTGRPLGSYEKWSRVVGGILEYAGLNKFLGNLEDLYEQVNDEPAQWRAFAGGIFQCFSNRPFTIKELMGEITDYQYSELKKFIPERLGDPSDKGFSTKLGVAFRKRKDQIFDTENGAMRLAEGFPDCHTKATKWFLERLSPAEPAEDAEPCTPHAYAKDNVIHMRDASRIKDMHNVPQEPQGPQIDFRDFDDPDEREAIQSE